MPSTQGRVEAGFGGWLCPKEPRVETAGNGGVGGALDNGAAVRKEGDLVIFRPELQNEIGVTNLTMGPQRTIEGDEIHRTLAFVNLHRIPAAQSNARATLATKMDEVALPAAEAIAVGPVCFHFRMPVRPYVPIEKSPTQS